MEYRIANIREKIAILQSQLVTFENLLKSIHDASLNDTYRKWCSELLKAQSIHYNQSNFKNYNCFKDFAPTFETKRGKQKILYILPFVYSGRDTHDFGRSPLILGSSLSDYVVNDRESFPLCFIAEDIDTFAPPESLRDIVNYIIR